MPKSVQTLLEDIRSLGAMQFEVVEAVRALVKSSLPSVQEEVKYGGILFTSDISFCGVFAYKEHVSVEFSHGARIVDPVGYLEGSGKGRRHIKLRSVDGIAAKKLAVYLPLAHQAAKNAN